MISYVKVLNTVATAGGDAPIDNNGFLTVNGAEAIFCRDIKSITRQAYVAEVLQVTTVQITSAANNTTYQFLIPGAVMYSTGAPRPVLASVTSSSSATANEVASLLYGFLNNLGSFNFSVTYNATDTVTITAKTGYPTFGAVSQLGSSTSTITASVAGVIGYGLGSQIAKQYDADSYPEMANIVSTNQYTQWQIRYNSLSPKGAAVSYGAGDKTLVILVNEGATAANVADLQDATYGVLTQLALGSRATVTAVATTTCEVTTTTGALTLSGGSATFNTLGARVSDILVVNTGTSFSTRDVVYINGITTATTGVSNKYTATAAGLFKHVSIRPLPL